MSDRFLEFTQTAFGKQLSGLLGLPQPPRLRRAAGAYAEQPLAGRSVLIGTAPTAALATPIVASLAAAGAELVIASDHAGIAPLKDAAHALAVSLKGEPAGESFAPDALVFDASGIASAEGLRTLYDFVQPRVARLD